MKKFHSIHLIAILVCLLVVAASCTTPPPQTDTAVKTGDDTYMLTFSDGSVPDTGMYTMESVQDTGMLAMESVEDTGMVVWLPTSVTFTKHGK